MSIRPPALALWFLALGLLALVRIGVRAARGNWTGGAIDGLWVAGGALLLALGIAIVLRARPQARSRPRR